MSLVEEDHTFNPGAFGGYARCRKCLFHPKAYVSPKPITERLGSLKRSKYKLDAVANCNSFTQEAKASDSITAQSRGLAELDVPRPFLKEKKNQPKAPSA